jgi:hypothetical protein
MDPISLFGVGMQSYSQVVTAQRRLNCIYEKRTDGDKNGMVLRGTPGSTLFTVLPSGPNRGWRVVKGIMYVVSGNTVFVVATTGTTTLLGTIGSTSGNVCMSDNGIEIIIVDGAAGYILTISSGIITKIVDANFPNGARSVTYSAGVFICELPGTFQWYVSQQYAGATWTPLIFASKQQAPDLLVAVDEMHDTLILFGFATTEFWQDSGGYPNPFSRINGTTQDWGLAAIYSRCKFNNSMAFLGQNSQGQLQVCMFNGYTVVRISDHDIENVINDFSVWQDAVGYSYMWDGHIMYQLTFPAAGRSFLYDALTNFWSEAQTGLAVQDRHYGQFCTVFNGSNYISDYSNGNVYEIDDDNYTDNGAPIKRQLQSKHIRNKGNEFGIAEIFIDMDTGQGLQWGQGSDPQLMVQVSWDNGRTFGSERWISIGKVGQYLARAVARRFGSSKDFVFRLTMTDPIPFIMTEACAVLPPKKPL